ncbi:hypothetical protein [Methanobacterium formicicum]|uniref:Uncharacterized protein n=1 Tax=Methanobacterium formicicum TaxID=2162 RepID=A0A843ARU1_METFO|nr:hypothetical protein [Methanobacterium formicicum]MBF4474273.1 hypothetical protein [Methanobacterium formicicum]
MNDVFCNELEGKSVAIEFVNGDYKKGRIVAFHPNGYIILRDSTGYQGLIPTTSINAILLGRE